jgi:ketol-acid reductoisomerase
MSAPLAGATIAVLGFGNQGDAQALNLRDRGFDVRIGLRLGGAAERRARSYGFEVLPLDEALARCDVAAVLLPDEVIISRWPELLGWSKPGLSFVFAHGFALLYGNVRFPAGADVVLIAPTGPGRVLRERGQSGAGLPAYIAVHQDGSGSAWALASAWAEGIGCPASMQWRSTVAEETEVDLFGEQAVLCGGLNTLVTAAFETLVARGYTPEVAYLEVVHQLKYIADLMHDRGVDGLREAISRTALYGDLTRGPRVINDESRREMAAMLDEIRSGAYAREWLAEAAAGRPRLSRWIEEGRRHPIEVARRAALGIPESPQETPDESRNPLSKK